jgi:PTH1 family peptidyl-tRNA hydrolase
MNKRVELFVGLGNPGRIYGNTRHNLGFVVLDAIAISRFLNFKTWHSVAEVSFYEEINGRVWFLKPMTFMNLSGTVVASFIKYYKIDPEGIFVFHDDLSVPVGRYKIRMFGSAGGHKGIKSIIDHLYTNKFPRMKLGIGPLPKFIQVIDFVLSKFNKDEMEKINLVKEKAIDIFSEINILGIEKAVSKITNKNDRYDNKRKTV